MTRLHTIRAAVVLILMALAAALAPASTYAQSSSGSQKGAYVGGSLGVYLEAAEGGSGQGIAGSAIIGYRFGARWGIQGEFGRTGNVYCREMFSYPDQQPQGTYCHRDPIFTVDAVRRFRAGSLRPYIAFGLGVGVHLGTGVEIPIGGRFAVAPGVDVNWLPDMLAVRPKIAFLVRF